MKLVRFAFGFFIHELNILGQLFTSFFCGFVIITAYRKKRFKMNFEENCLNVNLSKKKEKKEKNLKCFAGGFIHFIINSTILFKNEKGQGILKEKKNNNTFFL